MFTISADRPRNLLTVTMDGFFALHDVPGIEQAMAAALATLKCPPEEHLTLCDISGCVLQSSGVVEGFRRLIANAPYLGTRLAVVTGASAARMQVRRILPASGTMICTTRDEAEAWLFPHGAPADPAFCAQPPANAAHRSKQGIA